jgi:chromosome partitioning protein
MTKIFAIAQHKGGTGKTTSTINIGAALAQQGYKVLLVDLDPQSNLSQSLGIIDAPMNTYTVMSGKHSIYNAIQGINESLHVLPSSLDLTAAEIEMSSKIGREYILKDAISIIADKYKYILIDCPPSLGLLTANAFTAANYILIPLQAQFLALQGLNKLMEVIELINKGINKDLKIGGVFITQYDNRKILNRNILETISGLFKSVVFKTTIRDNVALAEAPAKGLDVFRYAPKSKGAEDYLALTKEVLKIK